MLIGTQSIDLAIDGNIFQVPIRVMNNFKLSFIQLKI